MRRIEHSAGSSREEPAMPWSYLSAIMILGAASLLLGCSASNTSSPGEQPPTAPLLTEAQVFEQTRPQREEFVSALKHLAEVLPRQVPKGAPLDTPTAHCVGLHDTATFIAEERLQDPLADPPFHLGLAGLCTGTDVMAYLRKPAPGPSAGIAQYDPEEYEKLFQVPYVVVMRTVKYVRPEVTFKDSREKRIAKARKELCPHFSPEDCERAVKWTVDEKNFLGPEAAGEYKAGRLVMDMFLADLKAGKILAGVRFEATNSEKIEFESATARGEVSDDRFAEVLLADLQKNAVAKARAAANEAFHLFH